MYLIHNLTLGRLNLWAQRAIARGPVSRGALHFFHSLLKKKGKRYRDRQQDGQRDGHAEWKKTKKEESKYGQKVRKN